MGGGPRNPDRSFFLLSGVVSIVACGFLAWLLLLRDGTAESIDLGFMPGLNASLNGCAALLLAAGYRAIRRGQRDLHRALMVSAFIASLLFLVGYVGYHYVHGDTPYEGAGLLRVVYFAVLISHVVLSMALLPLVLVTFYFAARAAFDRHRRLARWTLPIWLYVSVSGVVVYLMLYVF